MTLSRQEGLQKRRKFGSTEGGVTRHSRRRIGVGFESWYPRPPRNDTSDPVGVRTDDEDVNVRRLVKVKTLRGF